ncbi:cell envelope integrity protein TolA [Limnohabitans sp. 63ED37-2]|uniref:cell envelope integrity protein TolA n=1 Tax=Limnohabitans sp. 63ED37-2 TaxID=1678128 RepID=UPI0007058F2C|nr:cell envelope integrity protein TolA [Limnohabitans sp. 63ED37-2]ALK88779.1 cell envelope integrity inner membrane protein TolA [Limnohabitans sp. 63ED37-2]
MGRAWAVAGAAHLVLFLALGLATAWKTQPQTLQAEAELWSAVPQAAAPRLQEPPPPPPEPEPEPEPRREPPAKPSKPAPEPAPDNSLRDAQIALEKKKQEELKKKEAAERQRKAQEKKKKEAEEKAAKDKAEKEKAAKEKALKEKAEQDKKEQDKKKAAEKAKADEKKRQQEQAQKAKQDKADEARAEALRQENLQRMQGMAGASGGPNATGTALKSSGPSASYAGRLVGRIKPNITYPGDVVGNPRAEVEVRVAPDGTITSRRIVQSSGNKAWDDAVLRAIDKTEILPKDTDGRVPPLIVLGFRPSD